MFQSRCLNNKINRLHERYNGKNSTCQSLLVRDPPLSVYIRNLQILATEIFKAHRDLSSPIFKEPFNKRTLNYELQHPSQFAIARVESIYNGSKSIPYLGPKLWNMVPNKLKEMS